ncbi:MAG: DUF1553 domain-containing protein [Planctomycetota bacterium]|nr:MAG: DUF1553 domain-containing protein [Planctomycetota bacterium]
MADIVLRSQLERCCYLLLIGLTFAARCSSAADERSIKFNRDVRPILSDRCFLCHGPDENQRQADLRLDQRESAVAAAVVPGKPDESELLARITSDDPDLRMPPPESGRKPLTEAEIDVLRRWITEGAEYEGHWAFVPPVRPQLPDVERDGWTENAIDRFVLRRLKQEGLEPSPEADRRTLIRRVSLDLTGLPPTPEEIAAFVQDESENAFEKVVDRLLGSTAYAEHMARRWLDAARYADTNGYQYDLEREQWVWRDWVIHAFDVNMPFDRFTIEQIAGDLLPDATDQTRLATGFHRNHPITIEGGVIDEEYRTEYVVDRVVTTLTVWLGLTMTCGRCHDHKYDPFTQRDFYGLFAFFNQVPERGLNGFDPKLAAPSPLMTRKIERIDAELAAAEDALNQQAASLTQELVAWEERLNEEVATQWSVIVPVARHSQGGAEFEPLPDQSLLVTGEKSETDVYELVLKPTVAALHAVRLEALTHESMVNNSTGRGSNGNFVLSEFDLALLDNGEWQPVPITAAEADYSQASYDIAAAIDGKIDRGGWAVDGNTKHEDRVAVFRPAEPLATPKDASLRIRLHFAWGGSHHIGRFRISLADRPLHEVPVDVAEIVSLHSSQRTAAQSERLTHYLIDRFGSDAQRDALSKVQDLRRQRQVAAAAPGTMVMAELPEPRTTHILFRGEYDKPREAVQAHTPDILPPMPEGAPPNRLGLAQWMVSPENPLTARVAVNRFWQRLFGTGIVATVEDFGSQGEWPTHPELLDWLAVEFMESGWDVKALHKLIVLSATYRQSSRVNEELLERDPQNRLLARGPRGRLEAEVIRDSALAVSGLLSDRVGGPSVFPYHPSGLWQEINNRPGYSRTYEQDSGEALYRRSLYTFWKRTVPPPSMATFDAPEREYCVVRRSSTNTPLQAFVLLHDPQFVEAARHLAERMLAEGDSTETRIAAGFERVTARLPSDEEANVLTAIFNQRLADYQSDPDSAAALLAVGDSQVDTRIDAAELAAWTTVARILLNTSEFITKP